MNNLRIFIGIPCPEPISAEVSVLTARIAGDVHFRKWTHPDDLHVTLHFLGDTPPQRLEAILPVLEKTAADTTPFDLSLTEPGIFGPPSAPRVLWLGLKEHGMPGRLGQLHQALRKGLSAAGCKLEDRPYRPHMTLARQGNGSTLDDVRAAWTSAVKAQLHAPDLLQWTVGGFTLFRSHLGRRPSYEKLQNFPFGGS